MSKLLNISKSLLFMAVFALIFASCEKKIVQAPTGGDQFDMELRGGDGTDSSSNNDDGGVHDGDDDDDFDTEDEDSDSEKDNGGDGKLNGRG